MNDLLARLARAAGVGHELASRIDAVEWHWARPWVWWGGLALLVPLAWWICRRHEQRLPWLSVPLRRALNVCRIGVLGLLVFVLAGPFLRLDERIVQKPVVALVVDESDSMDLPVGRLPAAGIGAVAGALGLAAPSDGDEAAEALVESIGRLSRREFTEQLLAAQAKGVLGEIGSSFDLRRYAVARRAARRDAASEDPSKPGNQDAPAVDATGAGADTALGEGIAMALDDASDRVLGGIILVTDGRSTVGIDPLDAVRRAAEASGGQPRAPVISIPIGSPEPPADIAVTDVLAAPEVALDDTVSIVATVQSSGLARRSVKVELVDNDAVAATVDLVLRDGRQQAVFPWHATKEGTSLLTIRVAPEPEEGTAENNALEFPVEVTSRKAKILVVDAAPRWDLRFLDASVRRDTGFEPTIVVAGAMQTSAAGGSVTPEGFAGMPDDVEGWARYDIVFLGDVALADLPRPRQEALVEAVLDRGVGLVFQPGGEHLPKDFAGEPLEELFPVELDRAAGGSDAALEAADFRPFRMRVTARGAMHPAFAVSGDAGRNRATWSGMPPFFRVAAARGAKPAATVLADVERPGGMAGGDGPVPLVVEMPAGRGRVAWIGTEETFRWRRNVGDALFWRFWGQALRSVARRDDRPWDATWLVVTPNRCEPGSPVFVELNLVDGDRKPVVAAGQTLSIDSPDGAGGTILLRSASRPGLFQGSFVPTVAGTHGVTLDRGAAGELTTELLVAEPTRERAHPGVDREMLRTLADLTAGALVEAGDVATIPGRLATGSIETRRQVDDDIWDTWPVLALLVGLYCADIAIRRLSGLS
jgi:hypothetical protein